MITREQLRLAALAAGYTVYAWYMRGDGEIAHADIGRDDLVAWRPHLDEGDAARLAVRLNIMTDSEPADCMATAEAVEILRVKHDGTEHDKLRAWREAVVSCAVAIGERTQCEIHSEAHHGLSPCRWRPMTSATL